MLNDRMLRAGELWLRDHTIEQIAERMKVPVERVRRDLTELGWISEGKGEGGEAAVGAGRMSGADGVEVSRAAEEADQSGAGMRVLPEHEGLGC